MSDGSSTDKWGTEPLSSSGDIGQSGPLQTIQSKFLESIKSYAEGKHLQLVVHSEAPGMGYGYIQRRDRFSNLYAFRFFFAETSASFELGVGATINQPEEVRVQYNDGEAMDRVLAELRTSIDNAAKIAFPELGALARPAPEAPVPVEEVDQYLRPRNTGLPQRRPSGVIDAETASVWGQNRKNTGQQQVDPDLIKRRYKSHKVRNVGIIVLVLAILLFVPVLTATSSATGQTYKVSVTSHFFGIGGEYDPPGWSPHFFVGEETINGTPNNETTTTSSTSSTNVTTTSATSSSTTATNETAAPSGSVVYGFGLQGYLFKV